VLSRRLKRSRLREEEADPLSGVANLLDIMMVFACGLMIALVLSWNLQNIIFTRLDPQEKRHLLQSIQKIIDVEQGKELEEIPQIEKGGGSGYQEMGTVYRDAKTGKLIMIETGAGEREATGKKY